MAEDKNESGFTRGLGRLLHNPWSALTAWLALIGLLLSGVGTFTDLDKRVESNTVRIQNHDRELVQIRKTSRADREATRREMRDGFDAMSSKLDEINRYLRSPDDER